MKNMKIILFVAIGLFSINLTSQTLIDTLILHSNDTIACKITYVNNYSVFLKYQKRKKKLSEKIIPRIKIKNMIVNTTGLTIMDEKRDEGINNYKIKSKLDKKLDILLIDSNKSPELFKIGEKRFENNNGLNLNEIMSFVEWYNCKLVYISDEYNDRSVVVELFDAPYIYYEKTFTKYEQNFVYIIQQQENVKECYDFKFNKINYELCKKGYYEFEKLKIDTIPKNEYYIIVPQDAVTSHSDYRGQSIRFNFKKYRMIKTSLFIGEHYRRELNVIKTIKRDEE